MFFICFFNIWNQSHQLIKHCTIYFLSKVSRCVSRHLYLNKYIIKTLFHSITQYTGFSSKHYIASRFVFTLLCHKQSQTKLIWQGRAQKTGILIAFLAWVLCFVFLWNSRSHAGKKRLKNHGDTAKCSANEIMPKSAPIIDIQWNGNDKSSKNKVWRSDVLQLERHLFLKKSNIHVGVSSCK